MHIKIIEVEGKPVRQRISLGATPRTETGPRIKRFLEAGEVKDVEDDVAKVLVGQGVCRPAMPEEVEGLTAEELEPTAEEQDIKVRKSEVHSPDGKVSRRKSKTENY